MTTCRVGLLVHMSTLKKQSVAFSMLELVMVIVVLGILATLAIPRMARDLRQEAADNILSAIRYTQHLALVDDKTDPFDPVWQKKMWRIRFQRSSIDNQAISYIVFTDLDANGSPMMTECAIDPSNGKYFYNQNGNTNIDSSESPNIFIGKMYGIRLESGSTHGISFAGGCSDYTHIAFDHLGRPHSGIDSATNLYEGYMKTDCSITFHFIDNSIDPVKIIIAKETGYAYIDGQPDS